MLCIIACSCHAQLAFDKTTFNFGTMGLNQSYLDIYLLNNSDETIYSIEQKKDPNFRSRIIQPSIPPGSSGILRIECTHLSGNTINGELALFINGNEEACRITVKGKYKSSYRKQHCPDFSKQGKKINTSRINRQKTRNNDHKMIWTKIEPAVSNDKQLADKKYKPNNLIILLDASSSMKELRKKELLQKAFTELAALLRPVDQVAVIAYSSKTTLLMPPSRNVDAADLMKLIENFSTDGYTNGSLGIKIAYQLADSIYDENANNEIILATDGAFNANETNNIAKDIISLYDNKSIRLSILGIHNKSWAIAEMRHLAKSGRGRYMNVRSRAKAKRSLRKTIKIHSRL